MSYINEYMSIEYCNKCILSNLTYGCVSVPRADSSRKQLLQQSVAVSPDSSQRFFLVRSHLVSVPQEN